MTTQRQTDVQKAMIAAIIAALGLLCIAPAILQGSVWWQILGLALIGIGGWILLPPMIRLISRPGADTEPGR